MFRRKRREDSDFFKESAQARRTAEDQQPWFLDEDDQPSLEVEAGRSAWVEGLED